MNTDQLKEQAENFQEEATETARTLKERALEWKETARDSVVGAAKTTDTYVRDNPWIAVGVVGLFAFTLGVFVGSRRR